MTGVLTGARLDHVRIWTDDLDGAEERFRHGYGFEVYAVAAPGAGGRHSVAVGKGDVRLVLSRPTHDDSALRAFTLTHGEGVADIALTVDDAAAAFAEAVARGARPVAAPAEHAGVVTATIGGFADVTHTFVQRAPSADVRLLPGLDPVTSDTAAYDSGLYGVDHFAVVLEAGQLAPTVEYYQRVLEFEMIFTERIEVGSQAMESQVVTSPSRDITLTILEPDTSLQPGQLDEFLKNYDGGGVQHVAFLSDDIVSSVRNMRAHGTQFLSGPAAYYRLLAERMQPHAHTIDDLRDTDVLADQDHDGQLFQIFARSVLPRGTLFFEVIERCGAHTFGTSNITSLYEAVELERIP